MSDHQITIDPAMKFGQPCVDGQRMTAIQVAEMWWSGNWALEDMAQDWPGMNRGAVLIACWHQARYGSRTWRARWKDWLKVANSELWWGRYSTCPMPPQKGLGG